MEILKNKCALSILLLLMSLHCEGQVYSVGVYSGGTSYYTLCSIDFSFPPYKYKLTEVSWLEDARGFTIMDVGRKAARGDVLRESLRVESGSEKFTVPLDSASSKRRSDGDDVPVTRGSGDFAQVVTQCATNRGGRLITNALPVLQAGWVRQSRPFQDIIVVDGDHFAEVQSALEQTCGKPDPGISGSDANARWVTYTPDQIGVLLNLTGTRWRTIVSVVEKPKP